MPRGVLGLNASMFKGYLRYIANRRATQIGLERCSRTRKTRSRG
jgi:ribonucleoside-diphosphate reductase beta chain